MQFKYCSKILAAFSLIPHKLVLSMRLTVLLTLCCCFQLSANSFSQTITISGKNLPLTRVFKAIQEQSGYNFFYRYTDVQQIKLSSIDLKNASVQETLKECFKGLPLSYNIQKTTIVITKPDMEGVYNATGLKTVPITISGQVTTANGVAFSGVTVRVKGQSTGATITDVNGKYTLQADAAATLVFNFIGFKTVEEPVNSRTAINIVMEEEETKLNEVVVTALGIKRDRKALGYSVTEVAGSSLTEARENNLMNALEGKVAGVSITNVATGAGGSANVVIRGISSLNGTTQPLYVVDGIPIVNNTYSTAGKYGGRDSGDGIGNINPDDIESMSILKGAAATALYGYRGSNGVILITTKRGNKSKGVGVEINSNYVFQQVLDFTDWQYEYGQGADGFRPIDVNSAKAYGYNSWGPKLDGSPVIQFDGVARPYVAQRNNISKFYATGGTATNTVSLSHGLGDGGGFRFSAGDMRNNDIIPNSGVNRQNYDLSINYKFNKHLTIDAKASYIFQKTNNHPSSSDAPFNVNYATKFLPTSVDINTLKPGYNADGSEMDFSGEIYTTNPWFTANKFISNSTRNRFIGSALVRYTFDNGLFLQVRHGIDSFTDRNLNITPTGTAYYLPGIIEDGTWKSAEYNADALLGKKLDITHDFSINASAGANYRKYTVESIYLRGSDFITPFLYSLTNVRSSSVGYSNPRTVNKSVYATLDFSYKNFLYLNTTARNDWYSTLAPGAKIDYLYPSVNGSFIFSELLHISGMDYGKLRAGYADVGGEAYDSYQTLLYYNIASNNINGYPIGQILNSSIPSKTLKPSSVREFEIGTELSFLKGRLTLDFSAYSKKTTNSILSSTTSIASGYNGAVLNVGSLRNKGLELLVTGTPVKTKSFSWTASANGSINDNKVLALAPGVETLNIGESIVENVYLKQVVGKAASQIVAPDYLRDEKGNIVVDPESGIPEQGPLKEWGSGIPKFTGGITNEFRYKNFNFSFFIDGKFGGKIFSGTNYNGYQKGLSKETLAGRDVRHGTDQVDANTYASQLAYNVPSMFIYDASFIKLRQIILGYTFPAKLFNNKIQGLNLSFVTRNIWTLMKKTPNMDPESNYTNSGSQGLEMAVTPPSRTYGLNLNVKF